VTTMLIDVAHPAHVHQFTPVAREAMARGMGVLFLGRAKDVTLPLLEASGLPFVTLAAPEEPRTRWRDARELLGRVRAIRREIARTGATVLLTRNPSGVLAGLGTRTWTVFDTDDGRSVGLHYLLAAPFADVVTTSTYDPAHHGPGTLRYRGFKALTFLHPDRFRPDPDVRQRLGVPSGPLSVVRFSAHDASHDRRITGLERSSRSELLERLRSSSTVVLSVEGHAPRLLPRRSPSRMATGSPADLGRGDHQGEGERELPAAEFLQLLADASLCVGDSQSVAAEAAMLGIPALRLSGFTGRTWYLGVLEERFGLLRNFRPGEDAVLLAAVTDVLKDLDAHSAAARTARAQLLAECEDVAGWFVRRVEALARLRKRRRPWPVRTPAHS
jgi:uncharacterized protein